MSFLTRCVTAYTVTLLTFGASEARAVSGAELIHGTHHRYGKFEARLRFAPGDGVVSSFFLWKEGSELADVYWNEIDIEKLGTQCNGYSSNALYGLPQANHTQEIHTDSDLCANYHTHAIEWTPDYLAWLLDGVEVRRLTGADLAAFEDNAQPGMQMRFNLWVGDPNFGGNFSPGILPVHQYINWVRYSEWAPGAGDDGSDFAEVWLEEFDQPLAAPWTLGTWTSPLGNSVHSPANLTIVNGIAVLSLTEDGQTGFVGQPPVDEPDDPSNGGSPSNGGAPDMGGANSGGTPSSGGAAGLAGGGTLGGAPSGGAPNSAGATGLGGQGGVPSPALGGTPGSGGSLASGGAQSVGGTSPAPTPVPPGVTAPAPVAPVPPASPMPVPVVVSPDSNQAPAPQATNPPAPNPSASASGMPSVTDGTEPEGCACRVGTRSPVAPLWAGLLLLALGVRRHRGIPPSAGSS